MALIMAEEEDEVMDERKGWSFWDFWVRK